MNDTTNVSYSTESCVTAVECQSKILPNVQEKEESVSVQKNERKEHELMLEIPKNNDTAEYKVGQKVEVKVVLLRQDSTVLNAENISKQETSDKLDGALEKIEENQHAINAKELEESKEKLEVETKLKVPQRKISRFLVSPVLSGQLDLPKNKDFGETQVETTSSEVKQPETESQNDNQPQRKDSITLELKGSREVERGQEVTMEVAPKVTDSSEAPVCGPEMITLEQLKISLDHLKQGGPVSLKDSQKSVTSTVTSKTSTTVQPVQATQVPTPQPQQTLQPTQQPPSQTVNIPQSTSTQQINVQITHQVPNIQQQITQTMPVTQQQPQNVQQPQTLQQQPQTLQQQPQTMQQQPQVLQQQPQTLQQQPQVLQQQSQALQQQAQTLQQPQALQQAQTLQQQTQTLQQQPQTLQGQTLQHQVQTLQQQTLQPSQISQAQIPQSLSQPQIQQLNQTLANVAVNQTQQQSQTSNPIPIYPQQTQIISQIATCTASQLSQPAAQPVPIYQQPIATIPAVLNQTGYVQQQPTNNTTVLPPLQINPVPTYSQVTTSVPLQATTPPQNAPMQSSLVPQNIQQPNMISPPTNIPQPNLDLNVILPTSNVQYPSTVPQQVPITPNYNNYPNNLDNQPQTALTTTVTSVNVEQSVDEHLEKSKKIAPNLKLVIEKYVLAQINSLKLTYFSSSFLQ